MKIIAIGRNYAEHIKELNNERPEEPVIFTKPDTAILKDNEPFYYPDFSQDIHHEVEILVKINKMGKNIDEKFAHKYPRGFLGIWQKDSTAQHLFQGLYQKQISQI